MRILVWTVVMLLAGATLPPVNAAEKWWNRLGLGKKPNQSGQKPSNPSVPETDEPPLAPPLHGPEFTAESPSRTPSSPAPASVRMINSKHIIIKYKMKPADSAGAGTVDLWITRDGQHWSLDKSGTQTQLSYHAVVEGEGTYGFILVARTGSGESEPPKTGDPAQFWIEVDLTKPTVAIPSVQVGAGGKTVNIHWSAADKNLAAHPITLYCTDKNGSWQPIAASLDNTGSYTWQPSTALPSALRVKVEAVDLAGNVGAAETPKPAQIGAVRPEVTDIQISPGE